jgi:hypothetical protein
LPIAIITDIDPLPAIKYSRTSKIAADGKSKDINEYGNALWECRIEGVARKLDTPSH